MAAAMLLLGAALVVAGVAFVFWPAALVLGGLFLFGFGALLEWVAAHPKPTEPAQ